MVALNQNRDKSDIPSNLYDNKNISNLSNSVWKKSASEIKIKEDYLYI